MRKLAGGLLAALFLVGAPLLAQMGMGMMPPAFNGVWSPVVGGGSAYEMVNKDNKKSGLVVSIVSKDTVDGKDGYWLEMQMASLDGNPVVFQQFMVKDGTQIKVTKFIFLAPGQGPIEMSPQMMSMLGGRRGATTTPPTTESADIRGSGTVLGDESVTTPAGTFTCIHWRSNDGTAETWISSKVVPWAIVKSNDPSGSMLLLKVITDAKSSITGTPMKMEDLMKGRGQGQ
jgi:hypothetical protein